MATTDISATNVIYIKGVIDYLTDYLFTNCLNVKDKEMPIELSSQVTDTSTHTRKYPYNKGQKDGYTIRKKVTRKVSLIGLNDATAYPGTTSSSSLPYRCNYEKGDIEKRIRLTFANNHLIEDENTTLSYRDPTYGKPIVSLDEQYYILRVIAEFLARNVVTVVSTRYQKSYLYFIGTDTKPSPSTEARNGFADYRISRTTSAPSYKLDNNLCDFFEKMMDKIRDVVDADHTSAEPYTRNIVALQYQVTDSDNK